MEKKRCYSDFRRYLIQLYSGMFTGLVFMSCIASCLGFAKTFSELASLLFICLTSAAMFFLANQH